MKYRALCPHCGIRLSRRLSLGSLPHVRRECSRCQKPFQPVAWSEYLGGTILIIVAVLPILFVGAIGWPMAIALAILVLALAVYLWPYLTLFEKVSANASDDA